MTIEWLRRTMDTWDGEVRTALFATESIAFRMTAPDVLPPGSSPSLA